MRGGRWPIRYSAMGSGCLAMRYYPIYLDLRGKGCLVVGGGRVATRKVETLLQAHARVVVVSRKASARLTALAETQQIELACRDYRSGDLQGMFLVFGATSDAVLNRRIGDEARRCGILCNIVDQPTHGQFIVPAVVSRGDLLISISTAGHSPALAKRIRKQIEIRYGEEYALLLELLGAVRRKLLTQGHDPEGHKALLARLLEDDLAARIKAGEIRQIDRVLMDTLGEEFRWEVLMSSTV